MGRELLILPFNTGMERRGLERLGRESVTAFRGFFGQPVVLEHRQPKTADFPSSAQVFRERRDAGGGMALNCTPDAGIYPFLKSEYGSEYLVLITDMPLVFACSYAGGTADRYNRKAAATTLALSEGGYTSGPVMLRRLRGVVLHELGHLFDLNHHEVKVSRAKYCPMKNSIFVEGAYGMKNDIFRYLDSRARAFCPECSKAIDEAVRLAGPTSPNAVQRTRS